MLVHKGLEAVKEAMNKSMEVLKIENGKSKIIRVLTKPDDIISVYEHVEQFNGQWKTVTCLGKSECPLCLAGKRPGFKTYLAVLDRTDNKVKIFKASKRVAVQILGLIEEYGDLNGRDFKIVRQGEKLDTTYQFFPRDLSKEDLSQYELPDIESIVQPMTKEAIIELMEGSVDRPEEKNDNDYPF